MRFEVKLVGKGKGKIDPNQFVMVDHLQQCEIDYSGRKLEKFTAVGSRLIRCRFNNARIMQASWGAGREMSEYIECNFDGLEFDYGGNPFARFVRCSFTNVDLHCWRCSRAEFVDCIFTGRLTEAIFSGTVPEHDRVWVGGRRRNEFRGNDFSGMDLVDVSFRHGIDLSQQRLPTAPPYLYLPDAPTAVARARSVVEEWADSEMREKGLVLLNLISFELKNGQQQLLIRADEKAKRRPRELVDEVFALLRDDGD